MSEFRNTYRMLKEDPRIRRLKQYPQHKTCNTYRHCCRVALYSYYLAKRLGWQVDGATLARGALLHDYYQYDARSSSLSNYQHGTRHAVTALQNAKADFTLNPKEQNMIRSHMWPLTLLHPPRSREALLINIADKICAAQEMLRK